MESKRLLTRPIVSTQSKDSIEQQISANLSVPLWNNAWSTQANLISDVSVANQSPRPAATYMLGPPRKYDFFRAQKLFQFELNRRCAAVSRDLHYDTKVSGDLGRELTQQLRRVIKSDYLHSARYKIVVLVAIVQTAPSRQVHQWITVASRCLWSRETDGFITARANVGFDMMVSANAYALYAE